MVSVGPVVYGSPFLDEETERLFKEYDVDRDGKIGFDEFSEIIISNNQKMTKNKSS